MTEPISAPDITQVGAQSLSKVSPSLLRYRKSVTALTPEEVEALRSGISSMLAIADDRGYEYWVGIHGLPLPISCTQHRPTRVSRSIHRARTPPLATLAEYVENYNRYRPSSGLSDRVRSKPSFLRGCGVPVFTGVVQSKTFSIPDRHRAALILVNQCPKD